MQKPLLTTATLLFGLFSTYASYSQELKVASWNIAWLGSHEYNQRKASDYQQLANYAKELNADVIALQEVESAEWARKVLGDNYNYYFSTREWVQRVGVAVKKSAGLTVTAQEYKALDVDNVRHGMDISLSRNGKELTLLAVHLKSGCFNEPLDDKSIKLMANASTKEIRRKEACSILSKQIKPLENWLDQQAKEDKAYLVLGDFNRRFVNDISLKYSEEQGLWQALDDDEQQTLWTPTLGVNSDCWSGYYKDYIDHIVFNPKAKNMYQANSFNQLVFKEKYTKEISRLLSDHCPISVKLML
jgi:endonuclease/exonuclease/phosphatase family metal-dependent hydrolase